jgi:tetratricopeptide (TPR) repeat protein
MIIQTLYRHLSEVIGGVLLMSLMPACSCGHNRTSNTAAVVCCNGATITTSQGPPSEVRFLQGCIGNVDKNKFCALDTIDYPFEGSIFPPDIVAPTVLWHGTPGNSGMWLVKIGFDSSAAIVYTLTDGHRIKGELDSECIRDNNHWEESDYRKSARGWTPDGGLWTMIKERSRERSAHIDIYGLSKASNNKPIAVSHGSLTIKTSGDPVAAPIFYRDVPLMPVRNPSGVIQPLSPDAVPLIAWRLRDISKPSAPVVMKHMPTCINCHSFSSDGACLGMDMDGPQGDKGAYALVPTAKRILIRQPDVFTWNKFNPRKNTFGLFSRVSPDGRYVVSAVEEEVYVVNYMDYRFLQTFYPTRGLIALYDRQTKKITTLPGANDPEYVQCNPVWSPDGTWVAFLRAKARAAFNGPKASYANDPRETRIKYDLYRVPFNGGVGGVALPVRGAGAKGQSVSFPKYSPDGKWIVFVEADNGLLMRPDSRLYIIPAEGGKARELQCNLGLMNSWHSWSPNGKWLVFSSKGFTPFTQMFLTHIDKNGNASPAVLIPNSTAINRAVNIPEFVNIASGGITSILTPAMDYKTHFDLGKNLLNKGNIDSAHAEIMKAIALKPDYAENYSTLAFVLAGQGKMDEAMKASLKAVEYDPANDWVHALAGMFLYSAKKYPESIEQFKLAVKLNPNNAVSRYYYGLSQDAVNDRRGALENYSKAISIDTAFTDAYNGRGAIFFALRKTDEAIDDFSKAIAITPKVQYYQNRAVAYAVKNDFTNAFGDLDAGLKLAPDDGMTYYIRGNMHLQRKDIEKALADFKAALNCKQVCIQALDHFCDIYFSMDRHADAIPELDKMIARDPDNALFLNKRAIAYMYTGKMAQAVADFDFVISKAPGEASAYLNKARCCEKLGDLDAAVNNYSLALRYGRPQTQQYAFAKRRINELTDREGK